MKRTHLPLNALRVFDAAARHLSFTRAADELAVTPAAVGQQIRALEDHLGTMLFRRTAKGLELTAEGAAGLEPLREGFLRFEESVHALQAGQASDRYTLAAPGEFFAHWLAARLATFRGFRPEARFHLVASDDVEFTEANLDLAIRFADGPGELEGVELASARRVVVYAPGGADDWIAWKDEPLPDGIEPVLRTGNAGQALAAAYAGMGRTVLPELLVAEALASGALRSDGEPVAGRRAYWLVAPRPQWRQKKVRDLVAFLTD